MLFKLSLILGTLVLAFGLKKIDVMTSENVATKTKTFLEKFISEADFQQIASGAASSALECSMRCTKLANCGSFRVETVSGILTCILGSTLPETQEDSEYLVFVHEPCHILEVVGSSPWGVISGLYYYESNYNGRPSYIDENNKKAKRPEDK